MKEGVEFDSFARSTIDVYGTKEISFNNTGILI